MPTPILTTKLYIPPPRPNVVPRTRLIARLNESLHRKLTLIAAPAGFGKTTLLSAWVASERLEIRDWGLAGSSPVSSPQPLVSRVAWLSLDNADNDPTRFLTYLVAALQTIAPTLGAGVMGVLLSPQPPTRSTADYATQ